MTIKNNILESTGERFIPSNDSGEIAVEHLQRYHSIMQYVKGKVVLDVACGEGYGTHLISQQAKQVVGVDISSECIDHSKNKYNKKNIEFKVGSIADLPIVDNSIDVIVSFETIEHVTYKLQKEFIKESKRVLKNDGVMIISTPNKAIYTDKYNQTNSHHIKEFYEEEFVEFLKSEYEKIELYFQKKEVASFIIKNDADQIRVDYDSSLTDDFGTAAKYYICFLSDLYTHLICRHLQLA